MTEVSVPPSFAYSDAIRWLRGTYNFETSVDMDSRHAAPTLERVERALDLLDNPHLKYPCIRVTGTNGKTSTTRMIVELLRAKGLHVGAFTSPHLERVNERITYDGVPVTDNQFAEAIELVAQLDPMLEVPLTFFEATTAAALCWFADQGVDVAVIEVGIEGKFDATNVVEAVVSVATNVELDHMNFLGNTRDLIAREMASISDHSGTLVLGETDPDIVSIFALNKPTKTLFADEDFACVDNEMAVGGRLLTLRTPLATYPEVFLNLHGAHQGENAIAALVAVEEFFGDVIDPELVAEAFREVKSPGRMEVMLHDPLVIIDGAHNPAGAAVAAASLDEEFWGVPKKILVVGLLRGRDPEVMLDALNVESFDKAIICEPPSPRAMPAKDLAAAARKFGVEVDVVPDPVDALKRALGAAESDDLVFVTGSLYVVGAARTFLRAFA